MTFRLKLIKLLLFTCTLSHILSCIKKNPEVDPSAYLNSKEDSLFKYSIIRYAGKLPPKSTHSIKFDPYYDPYYIELANNHKLDFYYPSNDGKVYFQLSRIAPSLYEKYVGIGGFLQKNADGEIIYYEEKYRTWKMPYEELISVSKEIFYDMISGKSLEKYYTANTPDNVYIIEFPDENTFFDISSRTWKTRSIDALEMLEAERNLYYEKRFRSKTGQQDDEYE